MAATWPSNLSINELTQHGGSAGFPFVDQFRRALLFSKPLSCHLLLSQACMPLFGRQSIQFCLWRRQTQSYVKDGFSRSAGRRCKVLTVAQSSLLTAADDVCNRQALLGATLRCTTQAFCHIHLGQGSLFVTRFNSTMLPFQQPLDARTSMSIPIPQPSTSR